MVFSSTVFILYFLPIFLVLYFLTPRKLRNYTLLIFSLIFYSWGAPDFILILLGSTILNFYLTKGIYNSNKQINKKIFTTLTVILNVGLLIYFKYSNFFVNNINDVLNYLHINPISWIYVVLPIGISFFTFQSLTYSIDTYRQIHKPLNKLSDYLVYITMFPQMVAGPIIRYNSIADQLINRKAEFQFRVTGFYRFAIGLAKKVIIADVIGFEIDKIFNSGFMALDSTTAWIAIIGFTFQIYFDFAGYSDMAIGLGKMLGFKFPENFDNPYVSTSISDFWRRWHQTFSTFMKYYLYIPLGGNKVKTKRRLYFNLWFVFLVSGLWHGASWNFVLYGALQGIFIIMDKLFLIKIMTKAGRIPSILLTFLIIVLTRVFFRIEKIDLAWLFMNRLFSFEFNPINISTNPHFYIIMIIAAFFSFITIFKWGLKLQNKVYFSELNRKEHILFWILSILVIIICVTFINATNFSPFIYFKF